MNTAKSFCTGQIVTSDFSGPRRSMYNIIEKDLVQASYELHHNDIGIILDRYDENSNCVWVKILTSTGLIGYIPSIWIRAL